MNSHVLDCPYFLWDYNISETEFNRILRGENETERIWAISRLLESARYDDIWKYISLNEVKTMFPKLKLKSPVCQAWEYALQVWEEVEDNES